MSQGFDDNRFEEIDYVLKNKYTDGAQSFFIPKIFFLILSKEKMLKLQHRGLRLSS